MKLGYIILYVENVAGAVKFYEKAFGLTVKFMHEAGSYAEMDSAETKLAFASYEIAEEASGIELPRGVQNGFELAFTTGTVHADFDKAVAAGAEPLKQPAEMPWGQTVSYVRDPYGTLVEICTPME